jgi:4-guanidinobutyraldehyde dehydrogenase/NAD-dependent aldehyde dehydrogenase
MTTKAPALTTSDWLARAAEVAPRRELFIDGRFVPSASGRTFEDITGRDGSKIADVAEGDTEDVDRAVAAARAAFDDRRWSDQAPANRKRVLLKLADLIRANRDELALLESLDVGKPIRDTLSVDVPSAAKTIQWYAETIDKVYGEIGPTGPDALSLVTREPIGVVAAIVPWNYPLIITAWKLGAALSTGNSVILKPASQSPLTALRLAELASEAGLPDGVLNVVPGPGAVIGTALARHPGVDKITFTGSTEVGKSLLRAVGETDVKAITLELGGKSPQLVLADVGDLEAAAAAIGSGIFYNSGQTCNAGSRLIIHRSVREALVERIAVIGREMAPGEPLDPATQLGSIVDERQLDKVLGYVRLGAEEGARVVSGGERVRQETGGFYIEPTILDGVDNAWRVAREEIFGPVLTVTEFEDEADALAIANDTPYGLAAGIWTRDVNKAHRLSRAIRAGVVWVNTFDSADITVPFGGFKQSGFGRDKGMAALDGYTQLKTTWFDLSGK